MGREALAANPVARPILDYYVSNAWKMRTVGTYEERLKAWMEYCRKLPLNPDRMTCVYEPQALACGDDDCRRVPP